MNNDFVKVPFYVESDGSKTFFYPDCKSPSGYRVGLKGQVKTVSDYWDALEVVMSFSPPRFRRPNANGNFGGIVCEVGDVVEVKRSYLETMINDITRHGK